VAETRELSARDCERLLRSGVAGRVAVSTPTGPHIVPVNYTVVDDAIIVRTSPYSLLGTYGRDAMLAFGIDGFDNSGHRRGWSVQARGRVHAVVDRTEMERIREVAEPQPLAGGARFLYLRLRWTELSGRKLGTDWDPTRDLPVAADA
jgi:nitroimidazol reductase NimA-like FMN-containing flavoprotein (pyridoxamine 5'-phosphate oxidase superfamily)